MMEERDRTGQTSRGRLIVPIVLLAAVLAIGGLSWTLWSDNQLGVPAGGARVSKDADTTVGRTAPSQTAAESGVGKNDPAGLEDDTGGRARAIKQSSRPLQLNSQQINDVSRIIAQQKPPRIDQAPFEMMIGAAVPQQVAVADIPPEITQVMNGYWGNSYVMVKDQLVIVDQHSRRVVAIVPTAG